MLLGMSQKLSIFLLGQCQNLVMQQMADAVDNSKQQRIQAGSLTFHHQKSFPLFNSTSAAYLHGELTHWMFMTCRARARHMLLGFFSDDHSTYYAKVVALRLWWCYCYYFFGCYSLKHFEIWLFKFEPLNLKSFCLTSSELVILTAVGQMHYSRHRNNHGVSWKLVLNFHSSCEKYNEDLNHHVDSIVLPQEKFALEACTWQWNRALGETALPTLLLIPQATSGKSLKFLPSSFSFVK